MNCIILYYIIQYYIILYTIFYYYIILYNMIYIYRYTRFQHIFSKLRMPQNDGVLSFHGCTHSKLRLETGDTF